MSEAERPGPPAAESAAIAGEAEVRPAASGGAPTVAPAQRTTSAAWQWVWLLHPVCFALFPLLSLYAANPSEIFWPDMLRPAALIFAASLLLGLALGALLRNARKAAVILSVALFLFFSYGHLLSFQEKVISNLFV